MLVYMRTSPTGGWERPRPGGGSRARVAVRGKGVLPMGENNRGGPPRSSRSASVRKVRLRSRRPSENPRSAAPSPPQRPPDPEPLTDPEPPVADAQAARSDLPPRSDSPPGSDSPPRWDAALEANASTGRASRPSRPQQTAGGHAEANSDGDETVTFSFRGPKSLRKQLRLHSAETDRSVQDIAIEALEEYLERRDR